MVLEHIEQLKQQYTDKYVVVDDTRPELRRFKGQTGTVKTVNMSGRALVEFDAYENIGWYDIELDFLKVIDKPLPKPEKPAAAPAKKPAAKPAAAKKPAAGKGMSVEDMLAAARGEKSGGAKPAAAAAPKAKAAKPAAVAKTDPKKMSVEAMLAAARAETSGGDVAAAAEPAAVEPEPAPAPEPEPTPETAVTPRSELPTEIADILAYCRKVDAQ